ncbi:MAG: response regulator transcription factor [Brevundimonas sp.]
MRVLIIEDEPEIAAMLAATLRGDGFSPDVTRDPEEARAALRLGEYLVVLLDRRLDVADGLSLLPDIRARQPRASVLVVSALGDVADRICGLDAGADDYLVKPFDGDELLARIRASLRRPRTEVDAPPVRCGELVYLPRDGAFRVREAELALRRRERAILEVLIRRARRVVLREALVRAVYAFDEEPSSNTLDAQISRLRRKLSAAGAAVSLHAVRGVGYVLDEAE